MKMNRGYCNGLGEKFTIQNEEKMQNSLRRMIVEEKFKKIKDKSSLNQQKGKQKEREQQFWENNYKNQIKKWNYTLRKEFNVHDKKCMFQTKKEQIENFKKNLKNTLLKTKKMKQIDLSFNLKKVKFMRQNQKISKRQKFTILWNQKQREAGILRYKMQRMKQDMIIVQRQKQFEQSFQKWRRNDHDSMKSKVLPQSIKTIQSEQKGDFKVRKWSYST